MKDSRTFLLEPEVVRELAVFGTDEAGSIEQIASLLPTGLSPEEVGDVGLQVQNRVELDAPSRDGYSRGRDAEEQVTMGIGLAAVDTGDMLTAESATQQLRELGGVGGWLGYFMLKRYQKRAR